MHDVHGVCVFETLYALNFRCDFYNNSVQAVGREELDAASVGQRLRGHRGEVRLEAQRGTLLDALPAHSDCST